MMRVALVGDYPLDPLRIRGGVEAVTYQLAQGLARSGVVDLHVVTRRQDVTTYRLEQAHGPYTVHLLPSPPYLPNLLAGPLFAWRALPRLFRALAPDLIHAHGQEWYAEAALRSGLPTILTAHGIRRRETVLFGNSLVGRMRGWIYDAIEADVLRRAQHLIAISPYVCEQVRSLYRGQTYSIDNPVDDRYFNQARQEQGGDTILFVGNLSSRKRVPHLLQAFQQVVQVHDQARLTIVGHGSEERLALLRAEAKSLGIAPRVEFTGAVPDDLLLVHYARCTLLVLPSIEETAPVVIAQAMAAGKPVVATRVGGVPYMVADGETGILVDVHEVRALADGILRLLNDAPLRTRMGERARAVAERRFRLQSVVQKTLAVYHAVLGEGVP